MNKRLLLLTGSPGIGKTTILLKIAEGLKAKGYRVGGMISREARSSGNRMGFEILDLSNGKTGWLAHANQKTGPEVGRYHVNLKDLDDVGVEAITKATRDSDVIVVDEIAPMELFSGRFKDAVKRAAESQKPVVSIVHWKARDRLIQEIKNREDAELYTVTCENRRRLPELLTARVSDLLSKGSEE